MDFSQVGIIFYLMIIVKCAFIQNSNAACSVSYRPVRGEFVRLVKHDPSLAPLEECQSFNDTLAEKYLYSVYKTFPCEKIFIFKINYFEHFEEQKCSNCDESVNEYNAVVYNSEQNCWCKTDYREIKSASVVCKRVTEEEELPKIIGSPCMKHGRRLKKERQVSFIDDYLVTFKRGGKSWKTGNYSCNWSFYPWNKNRETFEVSVKVFVIFKYERIADLYNDGLCHVTLTATDSSNAILFGPECIDRKTYQQIPIEGKDISIKIDILNLNQDDVQFEIIAQREVDLKPLLIPEEGRITKYAVNEVNLDNDYNWKMARNFCKHSVPRGDLCRLSTLCPTLGFTTALSIDSDKVIVVSDETNLWTSLSREPMCKDHFNAALPKIWDVEKHNAFGNCENENCSDKNTLFCCQYDIPVQIPEPYERLVTVKSARTREGFYVYKFDTDEPSVEESYYRNEEYDDWFDIGRIEGDCSTFYLQHGYSDDAPNRLFVCILHDKKIPNKKYYLLSKEPCKRPWETTTALYTSFNPKSNLTPIYVGVSNEGPFMRSRVSQHPHCCGFDDPDMSFVIYVPTQGLKLAHVPPYHTCKDQTTLTDSSGVLFSPNHPNPFPAHITCNWRIQVESGKHILISFPELNMGYGEAPCRSPYDYIEFSNPVTNYVYGRVCGNIDREIKFETNSNELEISLSASSIVDIDAKFQIAYTTVVPSITSGPKKFYIGDDEATWKDAEKLCESKSQELCKLNEICPLLSDGIFTPNNGSAFIAIQGDHNRWVETKSNGKCRDYNADEGPPIFNFNETTNTDEFRDLVFCCSYPATSARSLDLSSNSVAVFVTTMTDDYGTPLYRFSLIDDQPSYELSIGDYEDYGYGFDLPTVNKTWKAKATQDGDIFGFLVSTKYEEEFYDQVIYFCEAPNPLYAPIKKYKASLQPCRGFWEFSFTVYGSKRENEMNNEKLTFATSIYDGSSRASDTGETCCGYEDSTFHVYVSTILAPYVL